jgi:hypothetical protein
MTKNVFALFIFVFCFSCFHKSPERVIEVTSLQKYSYLIFGFYDVNKIGDSVDFKMTGGTGFFIRKNGKIYLISAKHVLTPCNPDSLEKVIHFPDSLRIRMIDSAGTYSFIPIDIRKIKDTVTCDYHSDDPDVFCMEFKDTSGYIINSIENLIEPIVPENDSCKIYLYGFPSLYTKVTQETILPFKTQQSTFSSGYYYANSLDSRKVNFMMKGTDILPRKGCSGSPVFLKFKNKSNYVFGGVLTRADTISALSIIVKSKFVIEKIP